MQDQRGEMPTKYRATNQQLRRRVMSIKNGLVNAGSQGMTTEELSVLLNIEEPRLRHTSVANFVFDNARRFNAVRGIKKQAGMSYVWYTRGVEQNRKPPRMAEVIAPSPAWNEEQLPDQVLEQRDAVTLDKIRESGKERIGAADNQPRVIIIRVPSLPRMTALRWYALAVTVYGSTMTALEVWRAMA